VLYRLRDGCHDFGSDWRNFFLFGSIDMFLNFGNRWFHKYLIRSWFVLILEEKTKVGTCLLDGQRTVYIERDF
jgi:hypothetical protein